MAQILLCAEGDSMSLLPWCAHGVGSPMPTKKQPKRTVGVYVVRYSATDVWDVLVHRRSAKVSNGQLQLATPGGLVNKSDCVDQRGILIERYGFHQAGLREVAEKTGMSRDSIDAGDFTEISRTESASRRHINYLAV